MDRSEFPRLNDSQYESVRKMEGIFGQDVLRSLAAATPAEQQERVTAFETYERGLIAHVRGSLEATMAAPQATRPKPVWLKVPAFEGKEGENLHFWVRRVEIVMKAGLISDEPVRVAFALSNLGGRAKHWAYTRETTSPKCFASWAQLCEQLRAAFLPANNEFHQRSRFLACKQGKRELQEYAQEIRTLVASLAGNPLPDAVKTTFFMDGLKVGPARTQLFRRARTHGLKLSRELGPLLWMRRAWTLPAFVSLASPREEDSPWTQKSGGAGHGQVDEDSPATSRGGMLY
ncbi:hypothetical protein PInf_002932 [Phytophthora infestans]|nr:hypothetical protein PInf_002932 [Phytophthora infestans]